jgi:hypothetical protein
MAFGCDLPGRVKNLTLARAHCLYPLYEAVVNSIQAIAEAPRKARSKIIITVERSTDQETLKSEGLTIADRSITGFTVTDNGVGFNEENFESFQLSDTTRKRERGGKGVGRLLWLKAFDKVSVESTFSENGAWKRRTFDFLCTADGVENDKLEPASDERRQTRVRLIGMKSPYKDECPKSSKAISRQIIVHCMPYFVLGPNPQIIVHDPDEASDLRLAEIFNSEMKLEEASKVITIEGRQLRITHLLTSSSDGADHRLHYCANDRAVKSDSLKAKIPNLQKGLTSDKYLNPVFYSGFVTGDFLDARVDEQRTDFTLAADVFSESADILRWGDLSRECVSSIKDFLKPFLEPIQRRKEAKIEAILSDRSPQFRTMCRRRPDLLEDIPPDLDGDQLNVKLYEKLLVYETELKSRLAESLPEDHDYENFRKHYSQYMQEWNEQGISMLAQYVIHRKTTLELFATRLTRRADDKYALEEAIHELIFPMRKTSDEVNYESMNLWMIDERLAYHSYLASDKRLDQYENCEIESGDRPDIVIFNSPFAFAETYGEYNSIVIIEFKRPMRDDYQTTPDIVGNEDAKTNPVTQVQRYIEKIRDGQALDRQGRPVLGCKNARFYAYIICDLRPSMIQIARESEMRQTPDGKGYYKYSENYNAYMEIVAFDQLLDDARKRNRMFFDKLNIPDRRNAAFAPRFDHDKGRDDEHSPVINERSLDPSPSGTAEKVLPRDLDSP